MIIENILQKGCFGSLSFSILLFILRISFTNNSIFKESSRKAIFSTQFCEANAKRNEHSPSAKRKREFFLWGLRLCRSEALKQIEFLLPIISNILLATLLIIRWIQASHFPLSNLFESLLFLTWTITLIHILLLVKTNKVNQATLTSLAAVPLSSEENQFSAILSPFAFFTYSFAILNLPQKMQQWTFLLPALQSNWLLMHVSAMIFSYAILLSGSLFSFLCLVYYGNIDSTNLNKEWPLNSKRLLLVALASSKQPKANV